MDRVLLDDAAGDEEKEDLDLFIGLGGRPGGVDGWEVGFERPGGGPFVPGKVMSTAATTLRGTLAKDVQEDGVALAAT